jgi:hypothetical protein
MLPAAHGPRLSVAPSSPVLDAAPSARSYWSTMTMTTVGYGDVVILSTVERLYACFEMLLGAVTFAYMLGNVQHLMSKLDTRASMLRTRMESISAFMRHRDIQADLQVTDRAPLAPIHMRSSLDHPT